MLALAACSDGGGITSPQPLPVPAEPLASISCAASVSDGRVQCGQAQSGVRADRIIGGQRVNVLVQTTNVAYDSITGKFGFDLTVQNLLVQRMGSDGTNVTGIKVFFASGPHTTSGTGVASVGNPDGLDAFTGSFQPYFYYPGGLASGATTPSKRWELDVPKSVKTFSFTLYISTPLVPVIVFEMWPGNDHDVYRMGIDGNDLLKLSTSAMTDGSPTVAAGKVVFTSYRDGNAELYSVPLTGGAETRLTTSTGLQETSPALSPDGTKLAWVSGASGGLTKVWSGSATATGGAQAVPGLADAIQSSPNWKNSTTLAFTMAAASSADVWQVVPGSAPTLLAGGGTAEVEPAWSPDGSKVVFASNRTGDTELYLLDVGTSVTTRLTTRTGSDGAPTWLADGRIVFTCIQGIQFRLCLVDPANPGTITILSTPNQAEHASAVRY
ncbi:MAG TPA: hypothetical protein VJT67_04840 [Longimicrobiaceae bacterium]|nr:hypothetical protein [Longimicrobiaceae bacterium]